MKKIKQYLPILVIACLSALAWALGAHHYLSFDALRAHHDALESYIGLYPLSSFALYAAAYIAVVGLSFPGATFMTLLGGFLFGRIWGTGLVVASASIGATIFFVSAKAASQDLLTRKAGPWVNKMKAGFEKDGFYYLLTLRLVPLFPFVAINLVAAVLQIPLRTFIAATFIGIIPGSFIFVSIGDALKDVILTTGLSPKVVLEPKILFALIGLGVLSLLPVFYKRVYNR